jgi:hypothetical protein
LRIAVFIEIPLTECTNIVQQTSLTANVYLNNVRTFQQEMLLSIYRCTYDVQTAQQVLTDRLKWSGEFGKGLVNDDALRDAEGR